MSDGYASDYLLITNQLPKISNDYNVLACVAASAGTIRAENDPRWVNLKSISKRGQKGWLLLLLSGFVKERGSCHQRPQEVNMQCPCEDQSEMIWNSDWDDTDADDREMIISLYTCPTCETYVQIGRYVQPKETPPQ